MNTVNHVEYLFGIDTVDRQFTNMYSCMSCIICPKSFITITFTGSFELKVANNREPSAVYNVSNTSRRQSLLVPLTFNHQLTDLTLRDGGLGLLMYNDV